MGWEGFMEMERRQLQERREGKPRRAFGVPLPDESVEDLDRQGEEDRIRAQTGLVAVMAKNGKVFYKPLDDLTRHEMWARVAAEKAQVAWLKERIERKKRESLRTD